MMRTENEESNMGKTQRQNEQRGMESVEILY